MYFRAQSRASFERSKTEASSKNLRGPYTPENIQAMHRLLLTLLGLSLLLVSSGESSAQSYLPNVNSGERDPRNWPTMQRIVADRYELAGEIMTMRVHARKSDYYNCAYRHAHGQLMAFTLLGGPLETLTGYIRKDIGKILANELEKDPWLRVTVQVRYDPTRLNDACPDQVDILKWAIGWQYPAGTLSPGKPDSSYQPTRNRLREAKQGDLWRILNGRQAKRRYGKDGQRLPFKTTASIIGEEIELTAGARLSRSYSCAFQHSTRTHYSLRLHNGDAQFVHGYLPRTTAARKLIDTISLHRDVLVEIKGRVLRQAPSNYCMPQLEIVSWHVPPPEYGEE